MPTQAYAWAVKVKMKWKVAQSCSTLCEPMDCSPPGSSVHGTFQARVLEWVAISFSRGSSRPGDRTQVSHIVGRCFTFWATILLNPSKETRGEVPLGTTRTQWGWHILLLRDRRQLTEPRTTTVKSHHLWGTRLTPRHSGMEICS